MASVKNHAGCDSSREIFAIQQPSKRLWHDRRYALKLRESGAQTWKLPRISLNEGLCQTIDRYKSSTDWLTRIRSGEYRNVYEKMTIIHRRTPSRVRDRRLRFKPKLDHGSEGSRHEIDVSEPSSAFPPSRRIQTVYLVLAGGRLAENLCADCG